MEQITKKPKQIKKRQFYSLFYKIDRILSSNIKYSLYKELEKEMKTGKLNELRFNLIDILNKELTEK